MPIPISQDLYNRLLSENNEAFDAGLFNVAYHILAAAMHCAENIEADGPLQKISQIAKQQLDWIDKHHPEYEHSTPSVYKRSHEKSIFGLLSSQAETSLRMREAKAQWGKGREVNRGE